MAPILFKLTASKNLTRRLSFPDNPDWAVLSAKIGALFDIPEDKVGVTYVDTDGDEVTMSSNEELEEYYRTLYTPGVIVKLIVTDLGAVRENQGQSAHTKGIPHTPLSMGNHPAFGNADALPMMFEVDDDWQRLPSFGGMFMPPCDLDTDAFDDDDLPHGFVETVDGESQTASRTRSDSRADSKSGSDATTEMGARSNSRRGSRISHVEAASSQAKGKGRASGNLKSSVNGTDVPSTASIISQTAPTKLPVHVYNVGVDEDTKSSSSAIPVVSGAATAPPPITAVGNPVETTLPASDPKKSSEDTQDPPLPSLDDAPAHNASLANDVASLLNDLMHVFKSHPEVSEGFRNVVRNATNGVYWNAHRDAVARAAEEIRRSAQMGRAAEDLRRAEDEAGRRVSEALGGLFRAIGDLTARINPTDPAQPESTPDPAAGRSPGPSEVPVPPLPPHPGYTSSPWPPPPPPPPHGFDRRSTWGHWYHAPPYPPPVGSQYAPPPPPPPPPPPVPPRPYGSWSYATRDRDAHDWQTTAHTENPRPAHQDLRESVEAAKALYRAEKEKYLREREERKKARDRKASGIMPGDLPALSRPRTPEPAEPSPVQVVSNARGTFPQLEMYSVPRRHHTYSGPHTQRDPGDARAAAARRIAKRISDMGFADNPALQAKIKSQLPPDGHISRDIEDDVVTTILDGLLNAKTPVASGSASKRGGSIPGSWR